MVSTYSAKGEMDEKVYLQNVFSSLVLLTHHRLGVGEESAESLEEVSTKLLGQHVAVSLPTDDKQTMAMWRQLTGFPCTGITGKRG